MSLFHYSSALSTIKINENRIKIKVFVYEEKDFL